MPGQFPLLVALSAAVLTVAASYWWFGIHRRRQIELEMGVAALASMKWRDCLALVLKALEREGLTEDSASARANDAGSEHLLRRGEQVCLLSYKHGTGFRMGEANVRDLANAVQMHGAERGILVTLGATENFARDIAQRQGIQLLDGSALWPKVRDFVAPDAIARIQHNAAASTQRGVAIGTLAGLLLGAILFTLTSRFAEDAGQTLPAQAPPVTAAANPSALARSAASDAVEAAAGEARRALAAQQDAAALSEQEKAQRRVAAAATIAKFEQVKSALWSTQSTLILALRSSADGDRRLIDEACRILVQFEELRYSRLQLEPPDDSDQPVRWRQCQ